MVFVKHLNLLILKCNNLKWIDRSKVCIFENEVNDYYYYRIHLFFFKVSCI